MNENNLTDGWKICPDCNGNCWDQSKLESMKQLEDDCWCDRCQGSGQIPKETINQRKI